MTSSANGFNLQFVHNIETFYDVLCVDFFPALGAPTNSTLANAVAAARATSSPLGPLITGPTNNNSMSQGNAGAVGGTPTSPASSQFLLSRVGLELPTDDEIIIQVGIVYHALIAYGVRSSARSSDTR